MKADDDVSGPMKSAVKDRLATNMMELLEPIMAAMPYICFVA
jgi:hypothetical protein